MACPIGKVFIVPFLMSALSPSSPPAPSPTAEQKRGWEDWLREEPGVGQECWEVQRLTGMCYTAGRNSPNLWEAAC